MIFSEEVKLLKPCLQTRPTVKQWLDGVDDMGKRPQLALNPGSCGGGRSFDSRLRTLPGGLARCPVCLKQSCDSPPLPASTLRYKETLTW